MIFNLNLNKQIMKTRMILLIVVLTGGLTHCKKTENEDISKLNFCAGKEISDVIVSYDDIIGYDSTDYVFRVKESAWNRLQNKITPMYPDPQFGFSVTLDKQIIYTTQFIPGYYSASRNDILTFLLYEPDLVYITLGYPSSDHFTGEDLRNDERILRQMEADNKLIEIDD
jgi:hypothetical protein